MSISGRNNVTHKDNTKRQRDEILGNPGVITAQIVMNSVFDNNCKLWIISNLEGNSMFTGQMGSGEKVIIGFTNSEICLAHINKKEVVDNIKMIFGKRAILVNMSVLKMNTFLSATDAKQESDSKVSMAVVNPSNNVFIPIKIPQLASYLIENSKEKSLPDFFEEQSDFVRIIYDKETKRYIIDDTENVLDD